MKPRIMPACLSAAGVGALLTAPFLTWFDYGPFSTLFPSKVSLVWLLESGYWLTPVLYLLGVAAAILATGMSRRPFAFVGALPAAFSVFILAATLDTFFDGSMAYAQAVTFGTFTALPGSALLESSYFAYRRTSGRSSAWNPWERRILHLRALSVRESIGLGVYPLTKGQLSRPRPSRSRL